MRSKMLKEVTTTTVQAATMNFKDGELTNVLLKPFVTIGDVSEEKARKMLETKYKKTVFIIDRKVETKVYEMQVTDFLKYAKPVVKKADQPAEKTDAK